MGSRSKYKGQAPKKRVAKIETGYPPCLICGKDMLNPFASQRWHTECGTALQEQKFDGEQVLDMILSFAPPTPADPHTTVPVMLVLKNFRLALLNYGLIQAQDGDPGFYGPDDPGTLSTPPTKSNIILP